MAELSPKFRLISHCSMGGGGVSQSAATNNILPEGKDAHLNSKTK